VFPALVGLAIFCWRIRKLAQWIQQQKYISKYIKISKIGAMFRSFFHPALLPRGFSVCIQLLGYTELDLPTLVSHLPFWGMCPCSHAAYSLLKIMFASIHKLIKVE
jgi:hypothetical protein